MEIIKRRIEEINEYGYDLDFSEVFNPAFNIYKKIVLSAGVMVLLLVVVIAIIVVAGIFAVVGINGLATDLQNFSPINLTFTFLMLYCVVVIAGSIFTILLTAGFLQMGWNAYHKIDFSIGTVFQHFNSKETKELVMGATIIAIPNLVQMLLFEYFRFTYMGSIVSGIIGFLTFMTVPLIIFGNLKAMDAILGSILVIIKNFLMIFLLFIVSYIIALVGIIACGIGMLFTIPFMYAMQVSIYLNIFELPDEHIPIDSNPNQNFI